MLSCVDARIALRRGGVWPAPRLAGCHFVARPPFRAAGRGRGARVPAPGGRVPFVLGLRVPGTHLAGEPGVRAALGRRAVPGPRAPLALSALAHGARGKRLTRGSLELRRGKLCVEPRGAAARALEGAPGPWALGRRSPELGRFKKKGKKGVVPLMCWRAWASREVALHWPAPEHAERLFPDDISQPIICICAMSLHGGSERLVSVPGTPDSAHFSCLECAQGVNKSAQ